MINIENERNNFSKEKIDESKIKEKNENQKASNNTALLDSNSDSVNKFESESTRIKNSNDSTDSNYIYPQDINNDNNPKIIENKAASSMNQNNIINISLDPNASNKYIQNNQKNEDVLKKIVNNTIPISPQFLQMFSQPNILNALKDQNQTIYLQKQLRTINKEIIDYIIAQLQGLFREIMKDKNGNYFCSDLFKECDQEQRIKILNILSPTLSDDCLNKYSSHSIQALIDRSSSEIEYKLILVSFNDYNKLLYVSLDANGAYTVQKIIERIPDRYREEFNFIFSSFIGFTSRQKYGIVTVKKFISETRNELITTQIMKFVDQNFMNLAEDQYANYLIQFLLEKWNNTPEGNEIKKLVRNNFEQLCEKKYSSFICELYIRIISPEEKKELIDSLNKSKIQASNNHNSRKILKLLGINNSINFNNNSQVSNNMNNNMYNYPYFILNNNNSNFNIPNKGQSRLLNMNINSNGNNNINNYNFQFNNNNDPYGNF